MQLRSPAEFYIKYLLVRSPKAPVAEVVMELKRLGLDYISEPYIGRVKEKIPLAPDPFFPEDMGHPASTKYVCALRIDRAFRQDAAMKGALELLEYPRIREFVESMLICGAPIHAIAQRTSAFGELHCSVGLIECFRHYFWNMNLFDSTSLRLLLKWRLDNDTEKEPELKERKKLVMEQYYKDPRKMAADMPHSPLVASMVQQQMGFRASNRELAGMLLEARAMAVQRALQSTYENGPNDSMKFANFVNGSRILTEVLELVVTPDDNLKEQFEAFRLKTDDKPVPTLAQLSAGQHTADLQPTGDKDAGIRALAEPKRSDGDGNGAT